MQNNFDLEEYLSTGIENIIKGAVKASLKNVKESIFIARYAAANKKFSRLRKLHEKNGEHIPPFLIASITSSCNLHCKGCYARENNFCNDKASDTLLTSSEWNQIFKEAGELGIGIILLAGGEPFLRDDVLKKAAAHSDILFPVFTNGTVLTSQYITLLDKNRNLLPVISIEGDKVHTDSRRGDGVYNSLMAAMSTLQDTGILFGASITVTTENIEQVTHIDFLENLYSRGCKVIFYVEYVPINEQTVSLAPSDKDRETLSRELAVLRSHYEDMIFISFPGDEKTSGGCLAAGRGFFHINPDGAAEPCPFSPYSDTNIKDTGLREALKSPLFKKLQEEEILTKEHIGGCVLFDQKDIVRRLC